MPEKNNQKSSRWEVLDFPIFEDNRGGLVPFEFADLPFNPQRLYFVTAKDGQVRGGHAHISEKEIFIATSGTITALVNDGSGDVKILLDVKNKALFVDTHCWHEFFDFSENAVLTCLSSISYAPGERNYLTDKEKFLWKKYT